MLDRGLIQQHKNIKTATPLILKHYKKNYHTTAKTDKDWFAFNGKDFPKDIMLNRNFQLITEYGYDLCLSLLAGGEPSTPLPVDAVKEAAHWEADGSMCLHISIILYTLLLEEKVFTSTSLHYVQGYYYHETRKDNPLAMIMGKEHMGIHAWLVAGGSVIDMTIGQEKQFFDFTTAAGNYPFIIGKVNEGMELKGINEPKKIVNSYIKDYAKHLGISKEGWIRRQVSFFHDFKEAKENV